MNFIIIFAKNNKNNNYNNKILKKSFYIFNNFLKILKFIIKYFNSRLHCIYIILGKINNNNSKINIFLIIYFKTRFLLEFDITISIKNRLLQTFTIAFGNTNF